MIMQRPTSGPVPVSKLQPAEPLDREFNIAVHHIANRLNPRGWHVTRARYAPSNLDELNAYVRRVNRIIISNDNSDNTIFADPETNYAFRAWHDWCHWKLQAEFDLDGEIQVAELQIAHLAKIYGNRQAWGPLIGAEVVGQAQYIDYHGQFPTDQVGFDKHYIKGGSITRVFH